MNEWKWIGCVGMKELKKKKKKSNRMTSRWMPAVLSWMSVFSSIDLAGWLAGRQRRRVSEWVSEWVCIVSEKFCYCSHTIKCIKWNCNWIKKKKKKELKVRPAVGEQKEGTLNFFFFANCEPILMIFCTLGSVYFLPIGPDNFFIKIINFITQGYYRLAIFSFFDQIIFFRNVKLF